MYKSHRHPCLGNVSNHIITLRTPANAKLFFILLLSWGMVVRLIG